MFLTSVEGPGLPSLELNADAQNMCIIRKAAVPMQAKRVDSRGMALLEASANSQVWRFSCRVQGKACKDLQLRT